MKRSPLLWALLFLCACPKGAGEGDKEEAENPAVRVAAVRRGAIDRAVIGTATVESESVVQVMAETAGRVGAVPVEEGDRVTKGQLLCSIDNPRAQVALERAQVELQQTERELANTARLNERGYVARNARDELEFRHRRAELEVKRAQEEVRSLRVVAPFAGVIARRQVTLGEVIGPQRPLFNLVDDQHLQAVLHIP